MAMAGMMLLCGLAAASAQDVKLAWNPNQESNIGGYFVHYGTDSGNLTEIINVGNQTTTTLEGLPLGVTHFAAVQAYNSLGQFSDLSAEISFVPRIKPPALVTNQSGTAQPDIGSAMNFGMVRLGAIGESKTFTITNTGTTTLTGLRFNIDGAVAGNFLVTGIPVKPLLTSNGSFEDDLDEWTYSGSVITRTFGSATNGTKIAQFSAYNKPNNGVLSQSIPTTPGVSYQLAFDMGLLSYYYDPQELRTTIRGRQTLVSNDFTLSDPSDNTLHWIPRTLDFTADSESTTITFADISSSTNGLDILIDHVRVIDLSPPAATGSQITTLAPGATATFTVTFKPTSGGAREALLSLVADDVPVVLYEVKVTGTGSVQFDGWLAESGIQGGPGGNSDNDALNNLQEYAFGTNPNSTYTGAVTISNGQWVPRGTPAVRVLDPEDGGFQGLFARRKDHALVNLRYMPQFSADLIKWVDATWLPEAIGANGEMEIVAISAPDTINGMPARFFRVGVEQGLPPTFSQWLAITQTIGGTTGNPDGDALNNLQEFAFGTDPRTAGGSSVNEINGLIASRGAPSIRVIHAPEPQLQGMFGRRKDHVDAGLVYRPQFSADLITWMDSGEIPVVLADDSEIEVVSVTAPAAINGQPARFFRVGVDYRP
jgi:hypothetical protein